MARVTSGQLTGAGFTAVTATKYTKVATTAIAIVELATGLDKSGFASISPVTPGFPIAAADLAASVASLAVVGLSPGLSTGSQDRGGGLAYYGQSV
jgi:hypothetical protein